MRAGDLVTYYWPTFLSRIPDSEVDKGVGIVIEVRACKTLARLIVTSVLMYTFNGRPENTGHTRKTSFD